ncbi:MDR family MFS transporter [Bacillus suaedaesalsae]|uniref:MFS transporter n=1 Tax=Bacillus suaedaesalsae TaxID=2810349 RepID=A0ABS2DJ83_9BACI|nr:MDR family MFS transporter [Bacillus suaedaesalsae]MBM6617621.1 MFS transporter [Bacillus suaedaesalsae]
MTEALKVRVHKKSREKKTNRPFVLAAVMLAMFMSAIEATIVSTAMPAIAFDLGSFSLYSWVFSSYLLMNAVTVLIYGKLSDLYGRKPVLIIGIAIFLIGSILCGFANTMEMLILFRFIQGFGAGAVMPIASTIVGDMYTKEERAKIQGYLSSVWGISAVLGPAIGGLLVQYVSWKYVFWLNIPLGILATIALLLFLHEDIEKKKHDIDFLGAGLLFIGVSALMVVLVEGGVRWSWTSAPVIALISVSLFVFILFYFQEKRVKEPMMPFSLWNERSILVANLTSLTTGIMLIGVSSFLPAFVQGVMEQPPIIAGFTLTTMSIGWPIASMIAGRSLLTIGFRTTSIIGGVSLILGSIVFATMSPESGPIWAAFGSFLLGVGMGFTTTSFIVSIQSTVEWKQRGIATATNMFMRNLGSTIGAALLGGILNSSLISHLRSNGLEDSMDLDATNVLLNAEERNQLSESVRGVLQDGLTSSLHSVYWVVLLIGIISFVLILFLPKKEAS